MTITMELSTDQERLLREGAARADAAAMREVLLQAVDSTIEHMLRLASKREVISIETQATQPSLKELLLAESPRAEIPIPSRRRWRRRAPAALE